MNKSALSLAVCLAISYSSASYALGLGEIESSSHLNQPFRAKINLLSTSAADAKRLRVRVASPEVFSRVGIERPDYLNTISFTPTVENGKPVIMVSSSQPINQPFLNFLIEVSWPNGQLLKEYTVLLDPPVLVQAGTAVNSNTVGVRPEPKRQQPIQNSTPTPKPVVKQPAAPTKQTIAARKTPAPIAPRKTTKKNNRTSKYRVVRGDTLSKVAKKLRIKGVRDEQMMMALFRANPTAFRKRNINNLKAGALLRRPSVDEVGKLSYRQAKSSVYKQSKQWKTYRSKLAKNPVSQKQVKAPTDKKIPNTTAPENTQARIEVIGNSASAVDTKNLSAAGPAKVNQLERELTQAKESLAAKANANVELKSRVSELESLLRKKNRLITLKNEQLAELQAKLGMPASAQIGKAATNEGSDISQQVTNSANEGGGTIVRSGEESPNNVTKQPTTVAVDPVITSNEGKQALVDGNTDIPSIFDQEPENTLTQTTIESPNQSKTETISRSNQNSPEEKDGGILGLLSSPLVMGLGGGSLLALLVGWLLMRRKANAEDYEEYSSIDFDNPEFAPGSSAKDDKKSVKNDLKSDHTSTGFDDLDFGDTVEADIDDKKKTASAIDTNDDILQEADVYIVYGLHDQAEVELKKAIEKQPDNLHYHAKLLENYQASSNLKAFDKQAKIFSDLTDDKEGNKDKLWEKIQGWGQEIKSESSLFSNMSSKSLAGAAAAAVAGGIAVTAGKAFASDKQDDIDGLEAETNKPEAVSDINLKDASTLEDIDLNDLGFREDDDLDFDTSDLDISDKIDFSKDDFSKDDLDLDDILGDDVSDDKLKIADPLSDGLDDASLNDLLDDVESDAADISGVSNLIIEEQETELGAEFEDLLDLDLTDLSDDLSADLNRHDVSNLTLELNNDNDLNKILPTGSPYTSTKDPVPESNNLLGDLDDDLSFMDLDDDDDLKETQVSTKLDLARAYLDMGDMEGARNTLEEVMMEGNDDQKKEAEELLHQTG
ncbi:MAG: hypothetical protein KAG20_05570 [Cocleimonas sp.]|nr:hypothetical protein [Cocleimonas sp.]